MCSRVGTRFASLVCMSQATRLGLTAARGVGSTCNQMARRVLPQRGAPAVHVHVGRQAIGWGQIDIACREDASGCCRTYRVSHLEHSLAESSRYGRTWA